MLPPLLSFLLLLPQSLPLPQLCQLISLLIAHRPLLTLLLILSLLLLLSPLLLLLPSLPPTPPLCICSRERSLRFNGTTSRPLWFNRTLRAWRNRWGSLRHRRVAPWLPPRGGGMACPPSERIKRRERCSPGKRIKRRKRLSHEFIPP